MIPDGRRRRPAPPPTPIRPARPARPCVRRRPDLPAHPGRNLRMASKPKPETTDEAREQARRALQTSMDTRQ
ncbi:hypothetical protein GCM10009779_57770 [Polymorphospora rubra]|uniref:Uncharacterized protein n=1 Tax=Polymorphospora rubra TaxID=338584 RepID=A0A810N6G7_9ACTN|nr:hypothetical protein Prubr_40560 [Polymorphospora rubra]